MLRQLAALALIAITGSVHAAERPNVVLIFIDDMGYGDVGFNGATGPKTPNLDRMAKEGMVFDDFYVGCAVCSGSRTALMTGAHYQRLSMSAVLFPNSSSGLHPDEVTIADMLKDTGYATACIGKWHLGHLPPCLPTYQGFDYYYGVPYSNDMWIDPANELASDIVLREGLTLEQVKAGHRQRNRVPLMRGEQVIEYPADQSTLTKRYAEETIEFITANKDKPFFVYLPHTMVHLPLAVSEAFKNRTGKLIWDAIEEVDWSVGEIIKALKELNLDEKTLVIFTSDNGAAVGSSLPLRAKKGSVYDGGIREPTVMRWPGKIPAGKVCREVVASIDMLPTLAKLCDGKLPERKIDGHDIWPLMSGVEGATSPHKTYCLMHGPGTVRSGKWKFYPWREGTQRRRGKKTNAVPPSPTGPPVQLYDTDADISETTNLAGQYPDVVRELQAAWDAHVQELRANKRPTAKMVRPANAISSQRPGSTSHQAKNSVDWTKAKAGDTYASSSGPQVVGNPITIKCSVTAAASKSLQGVILAHGGLATGYVLYVKDDQIVFALRRDRGVINRVSAALPAEAKLEIVASATKSTLSIAINGSQAEEAKSAGLLVKHPAEGIAIGHDDAMAVDDDAPQGKFSGQIHAVSVQVPQPKK